MQPLRYGLLVALLVPSMAAGGQAPDCSQQDAMTRMGLQRGTSASFSLSAIAKAAHSASESDYRLVEEYCEYWDRDRTEWRKDHRHTYTYDAAGNVSVEVLWQRGDQDGWRLDRRYTFSYDATGSKIEALLQGWNDGSQQWRSPHLRATYSYDAAGRLAEWISQRWEDIRWVNYRRGLFEYYDSSHEAAGNLYQESRQMWENGEWVYHTFTTYVYVYVGSLRVETQEFEGVGLELQWRTFYAYDESGNLIEERTQAGDGVNEGRTTFTYDAAGTQVDAHSYSWDKDAAQWILDGWATDFFDSSGNKTGWLGRGLNPDTEQLEEEWRCTWVWQAIAVATEEDRSLPTEFSLSQNYPNPFNPTTTISYDLRQTADVKLAAYDLLGRTIRELASGTQPAGTYEVSFDATGLPSGVYFYRLEVGDFVETKRMVVVR